MNLPQSPTIYDETPQPPEPLSPPRATTIPFVAGSLAIAIVLLLYYSHIWGSYPAFASAIDTCGGLFCDFASFYFPMGGAVFRDSLPVQGFVYSPFIALLLSPFSQLSLAVSSAIWGLLQVCSVVLYVLIFRRLVPAGLPVQLLFVALALSSFPILHNFVWGQVGVFTTVALLGLLALYGRGHRSAAATSLAFAVSFKFFPLIFLAPFAVRRDIRFLLLAAAACGAFLLLLPIILLGFDDAFHFYGGLLDSYRAMGWVVTNYNSQYLPHVILRLAYATGKDVSSSLPLLRLISYSIAACNLALLAMVQREHLPHADLWSFQILFLTIPLVLGTSWPVDLAFFCFAQGFLAWWLLEKEHQARNPAPAPNHPRRESPNGPTRPAHRAFALSLLILSIVISNTVFFNLIGDHFRYGFYGYLFWADALLLAASYLLLLPPTLARLHTKPAVA